MGFYGGILCQNYINNEERFECRYVKSGQSHGIWWLNNITKPGNVWTKAILLDQEGQNGRDDLIKKLTLALLGGTTTIKKATWKMKHGWYGNQMRDGEISF